LRENGIKYIELLPYNKLAGAKYPLVGREYAPSFDGGAAVEMRIEIFEEYGIRAVRM
jgi:pyruvate formate lyase activating enzyme